MLATLTPDRWRYFLPYRALLEALDLDGATWPDTEPALVGTSTLRPLPRTPEAR